MTGGPFGDFSSPEAYRREAERAAIIGLVGKWAIHPLQVAIAQKGVFAAAIPGGRGTGDAGSLP